MVLAGPRPMGHDPMAKHGAINIWGIKLKLAVIQGWETFYPDPTRTISVASYSRL